MVSGKTSPDCKLGASNHPKRTDEKQMCLSLLAHLSFLLSHCPMRKSWMWAPLRIISLSSTQKACCGRFQFSSLHPNTSTKTSWRDDRVEMGVKLTIYSIMYLLGCRTINTRRIQLTLHFGNYTHCQ